VRVTGFHHVSVNTNGAALDEVVDFYRHVLGLDDEPRPDIPGILGHWHAVAGQQLHIVGAPSNGAGIDPTGHHFCVTVDDLAGAVAELEANGIRFERAVQGPGTVQIWIVDPAGNTVELQQDPTGGARGGTGTAE
jgi:glyoxylase I family protein